MPVSDRFQQLDRKKQQRIVSAALTEFARRGYQAASINAIVDKVGIAKGSIFNYFSDKQGLFGFVFTQALAMVKNHLRKVRAASEGDEVFTRIEKSLLAGVDFIRAHPRIYNLYLRVQYESGLPGRVEMLKAIRRNSLHFLTELLAEGKNRGELAPDLDLDAAAFMVDALLERFVQAHGVPWIDAGLGIYKAEPEEVERWAVQLCRVLRTGLGADKPEKEEDS